MRLEGNAKDGQEQLPTFFQWCKQHKGEKIAQRYVIEKVWTPNKYPDLTLETCAFRLRVSAKSSVFQELQNTLSQLIQSDSVLAISEIDLSEYDYVVEVLDGERGEWETLGEYGWKCTVLDKPKRTVRKLKS